MRVAISGASGFIGQALTASLEAAGHTPIALSRKGGDGISWDPTAGTIDAASLESIDAVVHLAGEGIAEKRWTDEQKRAIRDSRVNGTTLLAETVANLDRPPKVFLSGSAIGFYGDRGDQLLTEASPAGEDFLADVCVAWEGSAAAAEEAGILVTYLRTGIVLAKQGGMLKKILPLFKLAVGGRLGSGDQYMSWISIDDEVGAIRWLLDNPVSGPVNLTAPNPVTNRQFTKTLGTAVHRPAALPVPSFGPKLLLGSELAEGLLFTSTRVAPERLIDAGYAFTHATIDQALESIVG